MHANLGEYKVDPTNPDFSDLDEPSLVALAEMMNEALLFDAKQVGFSWQKGPAARGVHIVDLHALEAVLALQSPASLRSRLARRRVTGIRVR